MTASGHRLAGPLVDEPHRDDGAIALLDVGLNELELVIGDVGVCRRQSRHGKRGRERRSSGVLRIEGRHYLENPEYIGAPCAWPGVARHVATHSRPPEPCWGGTSRRENAGDVLGSRRFGRRLYRERITHGVTAGAHGIALAEDEGDAGKHRRDGECTWPCRSPSAGRTSGSPEPPAPHPGSMACRPSSRTWTCRRQPPLRSRSPMR